MSYVCPNCGETLISNTHQCKMLQQPLFYPSAETHTHTHRSNKCSCGGEFDWWGKTEDGKECCPFCGRIKKGNQ
jgi:DNA-directed RNA polymerase subunit RPC12/RpoP